MTKTWIIKSKPYTYVGNGAFAPTTKPQQIHRPLRPATIATTLRSVRPDVI